MKILFINLPYYGHVIPFVSDQPVNAQQVQRLGLGKILHYKGITPAVVKKTAFSILSDRAILENVQTMQAHISCTPGNTGAVEIIEAFRNQP